MTIWALIPLITCLAYVALLFIALLNRKQNIAKVFAYYLAIAGFWSFTSFMVHLNAPQEHTMLWNEILVCALVWTLIAYYHFILHYTNRKSRFSLLLGYFFVTVISAFSLSGNIVEYSYVINGVLHHDLGNYIYVIAFIMTSFASIIFWRLLKKYQASTDPFERNRTMYLLLGWTILVLMVFTNLVEIPVVAGLPLDHFGNLANAAIITYAISKFHLLDIKFVLRKGITWSIVAILFGGFTFFVTISAQDILGEFSPYLAGSIISVLVLLLAITARPLFSSLERLIDRIFYRETYRHRQELINFNKIMGNIINLDELADSMLPAINKSLNLEMTALLFQSANSPDFTVQYTQPVDADASVKELKFNIDSPIISWFQKKSQMLNPAQINSIPEFKALWQSEKEQLVNVDLGLLYPIKSRGNLIGILALGHKKSKNMFTNEDIELIRTMSNQAGIIIENAQLFTKANFRANTDGLTNLFNHRYFHQRIDQEIARASRFGSIFSLILLDLDLFKAYNDIYGHLAGDQLLKKVSEILTKAIRTVDMAFRYGGEEFAIILPETRLNEAYVVAERIRREIEKNTSFREMPVTASLGVSNWPNDGIMKEEIINRADNALYKAKETGRNRTCLSSDVLKPDTPEIGTELKAQPKAMSIIYALAATVDAKDHYTYGHSRKVSEYAVALAENMKMSQGTVDTVRAAGLLHDIGKVGVPDSVLSKPGPLDEEEMQMIRTHPELGVEILKRVIDLVNCLPAILHHHEHYNGNGYPQKLKGDKIPVEARILSIADAYDAITSPRPYHNQMTMQQALDELKRCAGTQFDPELVEAFCELISPKKLEHDSKTERRNGQQAKNNKGVK